MTATTSLEPTPKNINSSNLNYNCENQKSSENWSECIKKNLPSNTICNEKSEVIIYVPTVHATLGSIKENSKENHFAKSHLNP